jgi:peptidyl-prolyl cis-trans isomerase C
MKRRFIMYYKKLWMSVVVVALSLLLSFPVAYTEEQKAGPNDNLVLAKVGNREIKFSDLNKMIKMMPPSYQTMFSSTDQLKKLLDVQVNTMLFSDEAKRLKLDQKPAVKENIDEITNRILMQALIEETVSKNVSVSDKEIDEYYTSNPDEFQIPEKVKVSHILIKVDPQATPPEKEKKKAQAEKILARAKKGEDFALLAQEFSEDTKTNKKKGELGFFAKGSKEPEFENAAFALKKDGISNLVLTKEGYHIIKLLERKEAEKKTLKDAKTSVENKLKQKKRKDGYDKLLENLKASHKVVINEDALKKVAESSQAAGTQGKPEGKPEE